MDDRKDKSTGEKPMPPPGELPVADVGSRLRELFQAVEAAPVPDEISRLVVELEKKRTHRRPGRH